MRAGRPRANRSYTYCGRSRRGARSRARPRRGLVLEPTPQPGSEGFDRVRDTLLDRCQRTGRAQVNPVQRSVRRLWVGEPDEPVTASGDQPVLGVECRTRWTRSDDDALGEPNYLRSTPVPNESSVRRFHRWANHIHAHRAVAELRPCRRRVRLVEHGPIGTVAIPSLIGEAAAQVPHSCDGCAGRARTRTLNARQARAAARWPPFGPAACRRVDCRRVGIGPVPSPSSACGGDHEDEQVSGANHQQGGDHAHAQPWWHFSPLQSRLAGAISSAKSPTALSMSLWSGARAPCRRPGGRRRRRRFGRCQRSAPRTRLWQGLPGRLPGM